MRKWGVRIPSSREHSVSRRDPGRLLSENSHLKGITSLKIFLVVFRMEDLEILLIAIFVSETILDIINIFVLDNFEDN